jgi:3-deoxy-D-manno-octulosonate 8-phosphate phosphatase (KDO 8-P phosphatase)
MAGPHRATDPRIIERVIALRWLALDVDGTLTDSHIYIGPQGEAMKAYNVRDGLGLTLLREAGIGLAIITARQSTIVERRAAELRIDEVLQGVADKGQALRELAMRKGVSLDEVGFVGDDWPDLTAFALAGFAASVADAHPEVRSRAHWVSDARAGHGAIRELADFVLRARGQYEAALARRLTHGGH